MSIVTLIIWAVTLAIFTYQACRLVTAPPQRLRKPGPVARTAAWAAGCLLVGMAIKAFEDGPKFGKFLNKLVETPRHNLQYDVRRHPYCFEPAHSSR